MLDHVSDETVRQCLEALVQLHREGDNKAILSFVGGLDEASENPALGEFLLKNLAQLGKSTLK